MNTPNASSSRSQGFTLIEVLLVIVILGVIAAVAVGTIDPTGIGTNAKRDATTLRIQTVSNAVEMFELHMSRFPTSLNELVSNPGDSSWRGPYIKSKHMKDLWKEEFTYSVSGRSYEISSSAGGTEGGPISSKDLE